MKWIDFRGARGSNTGDDFHELWATRQAIRLLSNEDGLEAIAVEGLSARDEAGAPPYTWDGVDCTLYFGGRDAIEADQIRIEQLKYSAAYPNKSWTIARLIAGRRGRSVMARLAKAWKGLTTLGSRTPPARAVLISNQPVDKDVLSAVQRAAASSLTVPKRKPTATAAAEVRLAYATGLDAEEFRAFASALRIEAGAGSRFALEEQALQAVAEWTDQDVQGVVTGLRQFIRRRMMPECAGETITRESVLLHFGASEESVLFPCPSEITATESPVSRAPVREALDMLRSGVRYLCLHGRAGVGKTTALQEIEEALPAGSIMVKYDCYGGGRYRDPSALRHRSRDAFVQLTNELAARLRLPLLLSPHHGSDFPRLFANRLKHAARAMAAQHPDALIVVAIDAADNAVAAAQSRMPVEPSFVDHDFVRLTDQPENVRLVVTARTGRLGTLQLPCSYSTREIEPFSPQETAENVARVWAAAPHPWIDDFHHLSNGVPRVQDYAFKVDGVHPRTALDRLRPHGKSLGDIFQQQFRQALTKSGTPTEVARLCAALSVLPRPVPLSDLAAVLESTEPQLTDICTDLAPGVRLQDGTVSFADEDFEAFVRAEGERELARARERAAAWLLSRADHDPYAALHVAAALVAAGRGEDLLNLVEAEPAPTTVTDPVLRREAELQRVRLAIRVCHEAGDVARALRFVLIGAEGVKTEAALLRLLSDNPDLAARFAPRTARRLILSDADRVEHHGPLLFHKLSVDAERGDAISVREGRRFLRAWLQAREHDRHNQDPRRLGAWTINISDISSMVEAALKLDGPAASLRALQAWRPKRIALEVALTLPYRLIAEGRGDRVEALVTEDHLRPLGSFFLLVPLALAGRAIDTRRMARGLERLWRRKLRVKQFFRSPRAYHDRASTHGQVLDTVLTACEILTFKRAAPELVDKLLADFLDPELRRIDRCYTHQTAELDLIFRAYTLRETRAGRTPDVKSVFEPRPAPAEEDGRRRSNWHAEEHDRSLHELAGTVFGVYATVADVLVNHREDVELEVELRRASGRLGSWGFSREHDAGALRRCAATNLLMLLAAGYCPQTVKCVATNVHGGWRSGNRVPNGLFVARLSLWPSLHGPLLEDLAAAAAETRTMRIGADEKSTALVSYARLMTPLSKPDANEIFNTAVEVAGELDHEITAQIRLLDDLVGRGGGRFANARATACKLGNIVADAAVRLEGYDHFPWEQAMVALARLDAPLALANAARWDDEALARLRETMSPVLTTALGEETIEPEQAAALTMLSDDGGEVMAEILSRSARTGHPRLSALVEAAAWDVLIRGAHRTRQAVVHCIERHGLTGPWSSSLLRQEQFVAALPHESAANEDDTSDSDPETDDPPIAHSWSRETLIDGSLLKEAVRGLWDRMRTEREFHRLSAIFESARQSVSPADRAAHIAALAGVDGLAVAGQAVEAMLQAVDEWWVNPSVRAWCRTGLPEVIVTRFPEMTRYLAYGEDNLTPALERTSLTDAEIQELLLTGLERHGDALGSELIFKLAGMIGGKLPQPEAAGLADWYAERLEERIPTEHRDQAAPDSVLPRNVDEAVARFLFAYLGDCDLRLRWRAAHAVRRLARTGDEATLAALVAEYHRRGEPVFRGSGFEFFWLAARLWFVVAWDRIALERPGLASSVGRTLLRIALDDSFPHLLIRSFARDACEKLVSAGHLSLTPEEDSRLRCVNETPMSRVSAASVARKTIGVGRMGGFAYDREDRRFHFDGTDTLPYWYAPMRRSFAAVDHERFLQEAERWIIDVWGYSGDLRTFVQERRRGRFNDRDWNLSRHSHGSKPTLEPLKTHLEWHAMWCVSGELLKTEPLAPRGEDNWYELGNRVDREKLVEPPLWSADLLVSTPLLARNWQSDKRPLDDWVLEVREADHRVEIFPSDSPSYVVVDGSSERRMRDRMESTHVSSALVEPGTGRFLLRALQTMDDSWDYKLPDEDDEDAEIDEAPYRFLGWLRHSDRDDGIDKKDPFRGHAFQISGRPGRRVTVACGLTRDKAGRPHWSNSEAEQSMFVHEAWGVDADDEEPYRGAFAVAGRRLLAHKRQLLNFLHDQGLNLVVEVEVTRRERETRRYAGEEEDASSEGRFARLYLLGGEGHLEIAEGHLGTWAGDCPTA